MNEHPNSKSLVNRKALPLVKAALADTRVVLISGPRQAGKTTLARMFSDSDRPYITLDDAGTLNAAKGDPTGLYEESSERLSTRSNEPLI
jgi:predicted AAA+ superfamily ATPase